MTHDDDTGPTRWLSLPEVAELLDVKLRTVRDLVRDNALAGTRRPAPEGPFLIPEDFLVLDDETGTQRPLPALRGTLIQLQDGGFSTDEAVRWLLTSDEALGTSPVRALRDRRIHEVRRVAQSLAF